MTLRKPRKLKYPKKPKANASNEVLKNYLKRRAEVDAKNRKALSDYNKAKKTRESLKKRISGL